MLYHDEAQHSRQRLALESSVQHCAEAGREAPRNRRLRVTAVTSVAQGMAGMLQDTWAPSAAALLLRLLRDGRAFKACVFHAGLMDCDFVAYPVDTWAASTQRSQLFSSQWEAASQSQALHGAQASQARRMVSWQAPTCRIVTVHWLPPARRTGTQLSFCCPSLMWRLETWALPCATLLCSLPSTL